MWARGACARACSYWCPCVVQSEWRPWSLIVVVARKKRHRFAQLEQMSNVFQGRKCDPDWFERAFAFAQSVVMELGCGHGQYTLGLARSRPRTGVLGVDRNGARLWKGARQALDEGLNNAFFFRSPVEYLEDHISTGSISEIWLPFPDPLPKHRQAKHRLLSPLFFARYRRLLRPDGRVHLKTDAAALVSFAEQAVHAVGGRVHEERVVANGGEDVAAIETTYEKRYRDEGRRIYRRTFSFD